MVQRARRSFPVPSGSDDGPDPLPPGSARRCLRGSALFSGDAGSRPEPVQAGTRHPAAAARRSRHRTGCGGQGARPIDGRPNALGGSAVLRPPRERQDDPPAGDRATRPGTRPPRRGLVVRGARWSRGPRLRPAGVDRPTPGAGDRCSDRRRRSHGHPGSADEEHPETARFLDQRRACPAAGDRSGRTPDGAAGSGTTALRRGTEREVRRRAVPGARGRNPGRAPSPSPVRNLQRTWIRVLPGGPARAAGHECRTVGAGTQRRTPGRGRRARPPRRGVAGLSLLRPMARQRRLEGRHGVGFANPTVRQLFKA